MKSPMARGDAKYQSGIARQLPGRRQQVLAIACGWLGAIAAHFAWDAWLTFFPLGTGAITLIQVHLRVLAMNGPFTAVVLVLLLMGRRIEGRNLVRQLGLEAESGAGAIRPEEVSILASPGRRLGARLAAHASVPRSPEHPATPTWLGRRLPVDACSSRLTSTMERRPT